MSRRAPSRCSGSRCPSRASHSSSTSARRGGSPARETMRRPSVEEQLLRRALREVGLGRGGRAGAVRADRPNADRRAPRLRRPDARAREPRGLSRRHPPGGRARPDGTARGRADLGSAIRPARRGAHAPPRRSDAAAGSGDRVGVRRARAVGWPRSDRRARRPDRPQPPPPRRSVPRAGRAPAEDGGEDLPVPARAPTSPRGERARRARVRVRLLRPGAPEQGLPAVRRREPGRARLAVSTHTAPRRPASRSHSSKTRPQAPPTLGSWSRREETT